MYNKSMSVSHSKKIIHIHIPRTGGTSIFRAFSDYWDDRGDNPTAESFLERAIECRNRIGSDQYNLYYKFAFVRNPWDRMVSVYSWRKQSLGGLLVNDLSFHDWICNTELLDVTIRTTTSQLNWLCDGGGIIVDFVGKFENMIEDWENLNKILGMRRHLPHMNESNHSHYSEYYDEETREIVANRFADDIEFFGYSFD